MQEGKLETTMSVAEKRAAAAAADEDRRKKKGKKQKKVDDLYEEAFNFDISMIKMFGTVGIAPPTCTDELDDTVKKITEKKQWYVDNGESKRQEQIEEIKKQAAEEDAAEASAAATQTNSRGAGRGRGGYRGGQNTSRRGRGGYRVAGPRNEFDGTEEDDQQDAIYSAPQKAPKKK